MRKGCWECAIKHVSAAWEASNEVNRAADWQMRLGGNLAEAAEELDELWRNTASTLMLAAEYSQYIAEENENVLNLSFDKMLMALEVAAAQEEGSVYTSPAYFGLSVNEGQPVNEERWVRSRLKLAQCLVLLPEVLHGYPEHKFLIIGHLNAVEALTADTGAAELVRGLRVSILEGEWTYLDACKKLRSLWLLSKPLRDVINHAGSLPLETEQPVNKPA